MSCCDDDRPDVRDPRTAPPDPVDDAPFGLHAGSAYAAMAGGRAEAAADAACCEPADLDTGSEAACCEPADATGDRLRVASRPVRTRGAAAAFGTSPVSRRTVLRGLAGTLAGLALGGGMPAFAQGGSRPIRLAFCSQLLCVVPYEFTRARGFFEAEGLNVELVYTRGGGAAMQALVGGAVEYAATSFDVALAAFANEAPIRRFATTGRLPLFALATSPRAPEITELADLAGTTVGVSALGNADHVLLLYLLESAGVDPEGVQFATMGVNLFDALRVGQVPAGMVQEPSLSLLQEAGGGVLFNAMDLEQAQEVLGGAYEFMGVAVRADELEAREDEMRALGRALSAGLLALKEAPVGDVIDALPGELVAGGDTDRLADILLRYRDSLYPDAVTIDADAAARVEAANRVAGVREAPVDLDTLLATDVLADGS